MRVGILGLNHESCTFCPQPTTFADFERDVLVVGDAVRRTFTDAHHEMGGFIEGIETAGFEPVPLFYARAVPGGIVTADALDRLLKIMLEQVRQAGPLDALLVAPHGAAVSKRKRDMDGYWLSKLNKATGPKVPLAGTLDLHANLTPRMITATKFLVAYRQNPHLDQRERGVEAAAMLVRGLRKETNPIQSAGGPPVAIGIERQFTADEPCKSLYKMAAAARQLPGVLSTSILLGYPYADVEEMGSSFIAVTDADLPLARQIVQQMIEYLMSNAELFRGQAVAIDKAVQRAATSKGPVTLLDIGDNVGGGAPGDGMALARAIHKRGGPRTFVMLCDPESQALARQAGLGAKLALSLGGKSMPCYGPPLTTEVTVRALHDGIVTETEVRHGGFTRFDMGPTAVVETGTGLTALLTTHRTYPASLNQLTACGLEPTSFHILIAKGVHAPVGAYGPISRRLIRVNTPGVTTANLDDLEYKHRRRPMFPFERL